MNDALNKEMCKLRLAIKEGLSTERENVFFDQILYLKKYNKKEIRSMQREFMALASVELMNEGLSDFVVYNDSCVKIATKKCYREKKQEGGFF